MIKRVQLFAILIMAAGLAAGLAAVPAIAGPSAPMGIVTSAQKAVVGHVNAVDSTSLYDGDILTTEPLNRCTASAVRRLPDGSYRWHSGFSE